MITTRAYHCTLDAVDCRRWLAQLGIDARLPRSGRALWLDRPLGGLFCVTHVGDRNYRIESVEIARHVA